MAPRSEKKGKPKKFRPKTVARSLDRRAPTRTAGKSILIVCEDSKSSPDYFKRFRSEYRLGTVNVEVCGEECGSAPKSVVDFAKKRKGEVENSTIRDDYDEIFCVIDIDDHPTVQIQNMRQTARDNHIELIISNPCFEYWHILHFERTSKSYSRRPVLYSELKAHLKENGFKGDIKSGCGFFEIVHPLTDTAISNAKAILSGHWHNPEDLSQCDPSTDVHRVVKCIMDMAS